MKKFLFSLVMMLATIGTALGQKSYVNVVADHIYSSVYQEIYLTGDVPAGIKTHYDGYGSNAMTVGGILNLLAKEGFAIDDQDVREVARYNLQGLPVDKDEKGVQIIVFSNFTTRTIIVE